MTNSNLLACTTGKSRLGTLEDAAGIDADLPMRVCQARPPASTLSRDEYIAGTGVAPLNCC
jgi:hypothetical protein